MLSLAAIEVEIDSALLGLSVLPLTHKADLSRNLPRNKPVPQPLVQVDFQAYSEKEVSQLNFNL